MSIKYIEKTHGLLSHKDIEVVEQGLVLIDSLINSEAALRAYIPYPQDCSAVETLHDFLKGLEWEPERGARCSVCFDMRFERTALYAHENGYKLFSSSLGISRWKNMEQINGCGERAASRYEDLTYWTYNWRKSGGSQRMIETSKREGFYQQEYCGCVYSLRDTNKWRVAQGRGKVAIGKKFYGDE